MPEYTGAIGTAGEEPAPLVEVPEYTGAIGTAGEEPAPVVEIPEYTGAIGTAGDGPAPLVEVPEYTGAIGTAGDEPAPVVEIPEYTGAIGTAGDEPAPVVEVPEYTGVIATVGDEPAPVVEVPEYTGAIATVGDEPAPILDKPTEGVRVLSDKETGVLVAGLSRDIPTDYKLQVQKVTDQSLQGIKFDAYALHFVDKTNHKLQPKGAVLVRVPVSGEVAAVYYTASGEPVSFTNGRGAIEFTASQLGHYAVVYKKAVQNDSPQAPGVEQLGNKPADISKPEVQSTPKENSKAQLPATGESKSEHLFFLASLSLAISALFLAKGKKE